MIDHSEQVTKKLNKQNITIFKQIYSGDGYSFRQIRVNNSQETYMMKTISLPQKLNEQDHTNILLEIQKLSSIKIQSFIRYANSFIDEQNNYLHIIFDEDFDQFITIEERMLTINEGKSKALQESDLIQVGKTLFQFLAIIHKKGIIHGNLNSKSILIDKNNQIKICEVNPTKNESPQLRCNSYINLKYSAPEILLNNLFQRAGDIWSVGCILYELITMQPYLEVDSIDDIKSSEYSALKMSKISECFSFEFKNLLFKCLELDYKKRINAQQILLNESLHEKNQNHESQKSLKKMSSLKKICTIGNRRCSNCSEKKRAVRFEQQVHRTSILNGKSLILLLDQEKKDNQSESRSPQKSKFSAAVHSDNSSDEQQATMYQIKVSPPCNKRKSLQQNCLYQAKKETQVLAQLPKPKGIIKDKKFMSNNFMNYLDSFQKEKAQMMKKLDTLLDHQILEDQLKPKVLNKTVELLEKSLPDNINKLQTCNKNLKLASLNQPISFGKQRSIRKNMSLNYESHKNKVDSKENVDPIKQIRSPKARIS